jgi:Tfp pilus assembly protein PilO
MSIDTKTLTTGVKKYPILVVCVALSILFAGVLYARSGMGAEQQAELDRLVSEGKVYRTNLSNAAQLQEQLDFLIKANQAVKARALNPDGLAENLQYFYRLESEVGIKYRDLRPGPKVAAAKDATYVPISYTVNIEGSYAQVITFLKHLEQGAYFCRITSGSASGTGDSASANINLDLLGIK